MSIRRGLEAESHFVQSVLMAALAVVLYWPLRWVGVALATRLGVAHADRLGMMFEMLTVGPVVAFIPGFGLQMLVHSTRARIAVAVVWAVVVAVLFQLGDWWGARLGRV